MLLKVQYQQHKKYIKINESSYHTFIKIVKQKFSISPRQNIYLADEAGIEIDEDVFADFIEQKPDTLWMVVDNGTRADTPVHVTPVNSNETEKPLIQSVFSLSDTQISESNDSFQLQNKALTEYTPEEAEELVKNVLEKKPAGANVFQEYMTTGKITDSTRRFLVNALVGDMIDKYGNIPPKEARVKYAIGIVTLFPALKDPYSRKGYEHFYDVEANSGYIAWRLKTVQRHHRCSKTISTEATFERRGPETERSIFTSESQLEGDQCQEAIILLKHILDPEQVAAKMKSTLQFRRNMIQALKNVSSVLSVFPRFLDTKGLVLQDFELLFGENVASKLLEHWNGPIKHKVIQEAKSLTQSLLLGSLIQAAEGFPACEEASEWDSDMSSLLLLVFLLPPPSSGRKKSVKISAHEALDRIIRFHPSFCSFKDVLGSTQTKHPYILAIGPSKNNIQDYHIVLDDQLIPCMANSSLSALDELFKAHYVFGMSYDAALHNMFTFLQTTLYNIDVGIAHESPRIRDFRSKILN